MASELALVLQLWIDAARRHLPTRFEHKVLGIDPALSNRPGSDRTGLVLTGTGVDGQLYVIADFSGKYSATQWGELLLDVYSKHQVDYAVVEANAGHDLVAQNIRLLAPSRGLELVSIGPGERPSRRPGAILIKEVKAIGKKAVRAGPLSAAYERGRVSHVIGADLTDLEVELTTWEPPPDDRRGGESPDRIDALVHAASDQLDLAGTAGADPRAGFVGIDAVQAAISAPGPNTGPASGSELVWERGVPRRKTEAEKAQDGGRNFGASLAAVLRVSGRGGTI